MYPTPQTRTDLISFEHLASSYLLSEDSFEDSSDPFGWSIFVVRRVLGYYTRSDFVQVQLARHTEFDHNLLGLVGVIWIRVLSAKFKLDIRIECLD